VYATLDRVIVLTASSLTAYSRNISTPRRMLPSGFFDFVSQLRRGFADGGQ